MSKTLPPKINLHERRERRREEGREGGEREEEMKEPGSQLSGDLREKDSGSIE